MYKKHILSNSRLNFRDTKIMILAAYIALNVLQINVLFKIKSFLFKNQLKAIATFLVMSFKYLDNHAKRWGQ